MIFDLTTSALDKQVSGDHYKDKGIQPIVYIHANNLGFCEGNNPRCGRGCESVRINSGISAKLNDLLCIYIGCWEPSGADKNRTGWEKGERTSAK